MSELRVDVVYSHLHAVGITVKCSLQHWGPGIRLYATMLQGH